MVKFMREKMEGAFGKWLVFGIFGLIILAFALSDMFTGRLSQFRGRNSDVAQVGPERISLQELQNLVNSQLEMYKSLGANPDPRMVKAMQQEALQELVQQKLFLLEAKRVGIDVSPVEVMGEIQKLPYFLDKDKKTFSVELYRRLLSSNSISPGQFESDMRNRLIVQRMLQFLEGRVRVTDDELKRSYTIGGEQRNLAFIRIPREQAFARIKVSPTEVQKFLADPAKMNLVQTHYAANGQKYNQPEQVCARHILIQPQSKAGDVPAEVKAVKPTAANFAALAAKHSTDPATKKRGGDLGCFPHAGQLDKAFEDAAFAAKVGQVTAPVKSAYGWHYIYVYNRKPATNISLDAAKRDIAEELLKREHVDEIRAINKSAAEALAKAWSPKGAEETGLFSRLDTAIPRIGRAPEILNAAFDPGAKLQKGPQVFESQGSYIVAVIKERKSADPKKLETEKESQVRSLRSRKMQAFMPAWLENVRTRTKISYNQDLLGNI